MDEPTTDANDFAQFLADDLWENHSWFRDLDDVPHEVTPESKTDNIIRVMVDGERYTVTVTKEDDHGAAHVSFRS